MNVMAAVLSRSKTFGQAAICRGIQDDQKMSRTKGCMDGQNPNTKTAGQKRQKVVVSPYAPIIVRFVLLSDGTHYRCIFSLSLTSVLLSEHTHFVRVNTCEHGPERAHARPLWTKRPEGQKPLSRLSTRRRWRLMAVVNESPQSIHTTDRSPPSSPASPAIATREARLSQQRLGRLDRGSGPSRAIKRDFANKAFGARFHRPAAYFAFPTRHAAL